MKKARDLSKQRNVSLLVMGDFNLPDIDYKKFTVDAANDSYQARFFNTTQDLFFTENVLEHTRFRSGNQPSRLDYVLTSDDIVEQVTHLPLAPLGLSDHVGLLCNLNGSPNNNTKDNPGNKLAFWRGDYEGMKSYLTSINWNRELDNKEVKECWKFIKDKCLEATDKFIPKVKAAIKKKLSSLSKATLKLIKERNTQFQKYKQASIIIIIMK